MPTIEQRLQLVEDALGMRVRRREFRLPAEAIPAGSGLAIDRGLVKVSGVAQADVAGLVADLASKAALSHGHVASDLGADEPAPGEYLDGDNTWKPLPAAAPHNLLSASHLDTTPAAVVAGDLVVGLAGPTWGRLALGGVGTFLQVLAGPVLAWGAAPAAPAHAILSATHNDSVAAAAVRGDLIVADATPAWARLAKGAARTILQMGANDPAWVGPIVAAAATWHETRTFANIGTSYVVIYNTPLNGGRQPVDFTGYGQYRLIVHVNKVGTGTQSWILEDAASSSNVLQLDDAAAAGNHELDSGWTNLPAWATGEKTLIPKGKSTVAGDDPVVYRVVLLLK